MDRQRERFGSKGAGDGVAADERLAVSEKLKDYLSAVTFLAQSQMPVGGTQGLERAKMIVFQLGLEGEAVKYFEGLEAPVRRDFRLTIESFRNRYPEIVDASTTKARKRQAFTKFKEICEKGQGQKGLASYVAEATYYYDLLDDSYKHRGFDNDYKENFIDGLRDVTLANTVKTYFDLKGQTKFTIREVMDVIRTRRRKEWDSEEFTRVMRTLQISQGEGERERERLEQGKKEDPPKESPEMREFVRTVGSFGKSMEAVASGFTGINAGLNSITEKLADLKLSSDTSGSVRSQKQPWSRNPPYDTTGQKRDPREGDRPRQRRHPETMQCWSCGEWGHGSFQCDNPKRMTSEERDAVIRASGSTLGSNWRRGNDAARTAMVPHVEGRVGSAGAARVMETDRAEMVPSRVVEDDGLRIISENNVVEAVTRVSPEAEMQVMATKRTRDERSEASGGGNREKVQRGHLGQGYQRPRVEEEPERRPERERATTPDHARTAQEEAKEEEERIVRLEAAILRRRKEFERTMAEKGLDRMRAPNLARIEKAIRKAKPQRAPIRILGFRNRWTSPKFCRGPSM